MKADTVPSKSTESTGHRLKWAGRHGRQTESFGKKERKVSQTGLRVEMLLSCRSSRFFPFASLVVTVTQTYRCTGGGMEHLRGSLRLAHPHGQFVLHHGVKAREQERGMEKQREGERSREEEREKRRTGGREKREKREKRKKRLGSKEGMKDQKGKRKSENK